MTSINFNPTRKDLRLFAALQLIFFVAVALLIWRSHDATMAANLVIVISLVLGVIGAFRPDRIRPLYIGWMAAVFPIGWVVTHLVLLVVYYLVFLPLGLGLRIFGLDPMNRRFDPGAASYWIPRSKPASSDRYFRQF